MKKHHIYKMTKTWYGECGICPRVLARESQPGACYALEDHVYREHAIRPVSAATLPQAS